MTNNKVEIITVANKPQVFIDDVLINNVKCFEVKRSVDDAGTMFKLEFKCDFNKREQSN